ncbi:MAG TPA: hypothetical protein VD793_02655 [Gemmatimonadales bacterium]|nr:hypothetical protein [Gemmatimonadales bacterium]
MRPRWRTSLGTLAVVVLAGSCGVEEPLVQEAVVELASPRLDDGAVAFTVTTPAGAPLRSVVPACDGCEVFLQRVGETTVNLIVTGQLPRGPVARLEMTQGLPPTWFRVRLVAVASRTYQSRSLTGYGLTVR